MKREVETEKGRVRRSAAMRQKMPELERLEAELTEMKEILQRERETFFPILHKAPYGIILIDSGRRFLYVNPEFTRMTGYTVEDTHAERDWFHTASLFRQYSREILKTWKMDVLDKGIERILPVVCKKGEIRQIEFKPTLLDDGRIIVMLSDVTEKKQAEEELEKYRLRLEELVVERTDSLRNANEELHREIAERRRVEKEIQKLNDDLTRRAADLEGANKELEAFVYSVSHDLRTPLIGIHGLSQEVAGKTRPPGRCQREAIPVPHPEGSTKNAATDRQPLCPFPFQPSRNQAPQHRHGGPCRDRLSRTWKLIVRYPGVSSSTEAGMPCLCLWRSCDDSPGLLQSVVQCHQILKAQRNPGH